MRSLFSLSLCVAGCVCSSGALGASRDGAQAQQALARCLGSPPPSKLISTPLAAAPPGMSRHADVSVEAVPGSGDRVFAYQGTSPHEVACGVLVYSPVSPILEKQLKRAMEGYSPRWVPQAPGPYSLSGSLPGKVTGATPKLRGSWAFCS